MVCAAAFVSVDESNPHHSAFSIDVSGLPVSEGWEGEGGRGGGWCTMGC